MLHFFDTGDINMRTLLTLAFLLAFSAPAYAQNNTITVINEDGTKSSIDIGPTPAAPPVEPPRKPAAPARSVTPDPAPQATPARKPAKKPATTQQAKKETPVKKAPAKKSAAPKKKKAKTTTGIQTGKKREISAVPLVAQLHSSPRTSTAPRPQRLGPAMTPDDAIRIALDAAPPARSVHAIPVNYKGLHAYQVVFRTEEGDRSVFVDRESGRVVK